MQRMFANLRNSLSAFLAGSGLWHLWQLTEAVRLFSSDVEPLVQHAGLCMVLLSDPIGAEQSIDKARTAHPEKVIMHESILAHAAKQLTLVGHNRRRSCAPGRRHYAASSRQWKTMPNGRSAAHRGSSIASAMLLLTTEPAGSESYLVGSQRVAWTRSLALLNQSATVF